MKKTVTVFLLILLCLGLGAGFALGKNAGDGGAAYAAQERVAAMTQTANIGVSAYKLQDNTGYRQSEDKKVFPYSHPLRGNLINLSVFTQSDVSAPAIDRGNVSGFNAYGVTGSYAAVQLSYNFTNSQELYKKEYYDGDDKKTEVCSISSDTAQQVGDVDRLGVIGTGAMVFQKKLSANGSWEWQTKDGETKRNLHTVNFTDVVPLDKYGSGEKYTLYTPSGADLSKGVFIKITFAYELKITTTTEHRNWLGITRTKSESTYVNMLETAEFYLVQNSGAVLFRNATTFDSVGDEDGSGAISLNDFETILDGDVTLNGFRLDTLGVEAYEIKYRYNGGEEQTAYDGQFFLNHGRYDFIISRDMGREIRHTIFVDRREVNDAVVGYFGQSLFTPDSQRIYTTGEYPTYIAGKATWNLNATDGTVAPVVGRLYKTVGDGEEVFVRDIAQPYGADYKTQTLQGTIDEVGVYKAEFWGNPRYLSNKDISGDLYHFTFRFEIVDKNTPKEPSVNEAYLNGLLSFSDMQSKYYAVALPTKGAGNAIFAFSDYSGAYDFAYEIERGKVAVSQGNYEYNGKTYATQNAVLRAVDTVAKSVISERYFDATSPESYQTADIADGKITDMNFAKDVVVFLNDAEQSYMQAGLPSLNGRKYRYVSPDTGEIEEGVLDFAFVKTADFETQSVTLIHKTTGKTYDIVYGVSVEYQLGLASAPSGIYTVSERNCYGDVNEYEATYIRPGDMNGAATLSLFRGGQFIDKTFGKDNTVTESGLNGFILKSLSNDLDPYSIVKITHGGETAIYTFLEVSDIWFSDGGAYDFALVDRLGNTVEFSVVISAPVGYADVYLQLEQEDDEITKYFHVFVGQEIELPTPKLQNELYVFDGWFYDDKLITNNLFTPAKSGTLYVWQQVTQKYSYLDFDANGGESVERMKVEIGETVQLPASSKDGWAFGGWEYGGKVYKSEYTVTSASRSFVAVWNFLTTEISLYDGNLVQTVEAHAGEKVVLPFPTRTGYTFFGWREQGEDNQSKVYYGQITSLANVEQLRLDALWLRESEEDLDSLPSASYGRIMLHFVDGELLPNDSLDTVAGAVISLPNATRAGYVFVGWIWQKTALSGKIFEDTTMTVPSNAGNRMALQALWIARGTTVAQSVGQDAKTSTLSRMIDAMPSSSAAALGGLISMLGLILTLCLIYIVKRKGKAFDAVTQSAACGRDFFADRQSVRARRIRRYSAATLITAFLLTVVLTFLSAFGGWADMGVFRDAAKDVEVAPINTQISESDTLSSNFEFNNLQTQTMPTKEEVLDTLYSDLTNDFGSDLNADEKFLYSLIMLDYNSMGYMVFPANAILSSGERIQGIGYTDLERGIPIGELKSDYKIGVGFIAFPRQRIITEQDIKSEVLIEFAYEDPTVADITYILAFSQSYGPCHYVIDNKYIKYSVNDTQVIYTSSDVQESNFSIECGYVYSYDENRIIFDPNLGKSEDITATSLNTLLDPVIAENEYNRYIAEQTANGFTVDTLNFVFISYEALEAYYLGNQDESLFGIDVQEFYDLEKTLGSNQYYAVDQDGNLTKLDFPPTKEETKKQWLDRVAGIAVGIGAILAGIIISAAAMVVSCGTFTAIAPYITGAMVGGGIEILMQTLIKGKGLSEINWARVGIAAASGVLNAIPGVGWFAAGTIQGAVEAAFTVVDGGSLAEVAAAFSIGFVTGVVIHGLGKAVEALSNCFVAGTGVLMADGTTKAIENVRVGDKVKSYNSSTGRVESKRVLQTFVNETDELVTVSMSNGQQITSTPGHKFYANNEWISAGDLRAGDVLVNVNGEKVVVEKIQHEILDAPVKIYNFEVADNHTYFVGENVNVSKFILTHNKICGYRKALIEYTGKDPGATVHAHHQIPQKIAKDYDLDRYVNINDPKYLQWVEETVHKKGSYKYNTEWIKELNAAGEINKEVIERIWNKLKTFFPTYLG